jgi:hypothetical protein
MGTDSEYKTLKLDLRAVEVQQETEFDVGGFEHVQQLCFISFVVLWGDFDFNENGVFNHQVRIVFSNDHVFVLDNEPLFRFCATAAPKELYPK